MKNDLLMRISKWMLLAMLLFASYMHGYGQDSIPKPARIDRMSVIVPSSEAMQKLFRLLTVSAVTCRGCYAR